MNILEIIEKKKHGQELSASEIDYFVKNYSDGNIADYQASALMMAVWFAGMNSRESADLTASMLETGLSDRPEGLTGVLIDKHSTGGVSDATTLIACSITAACGGRVAKASGRGLGHTGGTIDKLESIPGLRTELSREEFVRLINSNGFAVTAQTAELVPADRKMYSLRDVTGTVDSLPLIASSVMSKKLAGGADVIVLDVKCGNGAFMKDEDSARELAQLMVDIGKARNKSCCALVTDMNQPLGNAVGNALEIEEVADILTGRIPGGDLRQLSLELAARMTFAAGIFETIAAAQQGCLDVLESGAAAQKLKAFIKGQGGDPSVVDSPQMLPRSSVRIEALSKESGRLVGVDTEGVGNLARLTGAGRLRKEDSVDFGAGLMLKKRLGDVVKEGDVLAEVYSENRAAAEEVAEKLSSLYVFAAEEDAFQPPALVKFLVE